MADFSPVGLDNAHRAVGRGPRLDDIKRADTLEYVGGQRRGRPLVQVEDLAPEMRPARDLADAIMIQSVITGIGIGL